MIYKDTNKSAMILSDDPSTNCHAMDGRDSVELMLGALENFSRTFVGIHGEDFFNSLTRFLGEKLDVDLVLVGRLLPEESNRISTLSFFNQGQFLGPIVYDLQGNPCEIVIGEAEQCIADNAQGLFPQSNLIKEHHIEAYIGVALHNSDGKAIGLLSLLNKIPVKDTNSLKSVLQILSVRVASELELMESNRTVNKDEITGIKSDSKLIRDIQHLANIGLWEEDLITGKVIWSDEAYSIHGLDPTRDEMSMEGYFKLVHPDDREAVKNNIEKNLSNKNKFADCFRIIRPDDQKTRYIRLCGEIFRDDTGMAHRVFGIVQDITESVLAQQAMDSSESQIREAQRIAGLGYWQIIFYPGEIQSGEMYWSDEMYSMYGLSPDEYTPDYQSYFKMIHPDDRNLLTERINEAIASGSVYKSDHRIIKPDGNILYTISEGEVTHNYQGNKIRMFGTNRDITERKLANKQALQYKNIVDASNDIMILYDKSGIALAVNQGYLNYYQKTWDELVGKYMTESIGVEQFKKTSEEYFNRCIKGEVINYQRWDKHPIKGDVYLDVSFNPHRDSAGGISGVVVTGRDITEIKLAEQALAESEKQLREAQRIAKIGSFRRSLPSDDYVWSDELYRIFDVEPASFIPRSENIDKFIHPEDLEDRRESLEKFNKEDKSFDHTHRIITRDRKLKYVRVRSEKLYDVNKESVYVMGTVFDITEQKLAELKSRKNESRLIEAQRIAHIGFWEVEVESNAMYLSDEVYKIYGMKHDDFDGTLANLLSRLHPQDLDVMDAARRDLIENKIPMDIGYRIVRPDGSIRYVHGQGELVTNDEGRDLIVGTVIDTTEQELAKQALRESEIHLQRIFDAGLMGIATMSPDGHFLEVNDVYCNMLGYSREEFINMNILDITPCDEQERTKSVFQEFIDGDVDRLAIERVNLRKDGNLIYTKLSTECVRDNDGNLEYIIAFSENITERYRATEALKVSEERYRALYDDNPTMFFTVDADGIILSVNEFGAAQLGYGVDQLIGQPYTMVFNEEDASHVTENLKVCFRDIEDVNRWELRKLCADDSILWARETARFIVDNEERPSLLIVCEDITEMRQLSEQLSYQASHDALTGLINRREFENRLQSVLGGMRNDNSEHALCYLDLDQFKVINDTCGHVAGDELLHQLGDILHGLVRKNDTLARLGGDEFGILMEHCTLDQAHKVASKLREAIEDFQFAWEDRSFSIGASIGLVPIALDSINSIEVLKQADAACYAAKDAGRNRIHVYKADDAELAKRSGEMQWVSQINRALEDNRFVLYAQPIIPLKPSSTEGDHYEILLRMISDDGDLIPPGAFLGAAERYSLSSRLDRWVVNEYFNWLLLNPEHLAQLSHCAINLSGHSLSDDHFLDYVVGRLNETQIPAQKICFEITETAAIANLSRATVFIKTLKALGCQFALDDFGSGLSSFAYLKNLPVDYLKIDGVFVKDIEKDPIDLAMVKSINDIGRVMGKLTIAEFVENEAILSMLKSLGVDYAQGYHIGKPVPIHDYRSLMVVS